MPFNCIFHNTCPLGKQADLYSTGREEVLQEGAQPLVRKLLTSRVSDTQQRQKCTSKTSSSRWSDIWSGVEFLFVWSISQIKGSQISIKVSKLFASTSLIDLSFFFQRSIRSWLQKHRKRLVKRTTRRPLTVMPKPFQPARKRSNRWRQLLPIHRPNLLISTPIRTPMPIPNETNLAQSERKLVI